MGDWPFLDHDNRFESFPDPSMPLPGANNTKSAYVQITAATGFKYHGFWLTLASYSNSSFDIAIGASGSEKIIVPDLLILANNNQHDSFYIPISIPTGTRIAARAQQADIAYQGTVSLLGVGGDLRQSLQNCNTYGFTVGSTGGTQIDPGGTINVKGSWVQISVSTINITRAILLSFGNQQSAVWGSWHVDIGIGSAGNEVVLIPGIRFGNVGSGNVMICPFHYGPFYVNIPSGTRLSVRAACTYNSTPGRYFDIALHCIY